jgi:nicotinamidase-related amidase
MQRMFAEPTEWEAPWMNKVLPAIEALVDAHAERTIFTRFITAERPEAAHGAWQQYYQRWASMTRERLPAGLLDLLPSLARHVPPARVLDKTVYSPWMDPSLHRLLSRAEIKTLIVTGGETEVCVLATVMGAIDHGYHVVLPIDAVCSSADETHDAMLRVYESRFGMQLAACSMQDVLDAWRP